MSSQFIRLPDVKRLTGLSRYSIYNRVGTSSYSDPDFPRPIPLSPSGRGALGCDIAEVEDWMAKKGGGTPMIRLTILPPTLQNQNTENPREDLIFIPSNTRLNFVVERGFIYYTEVKTNNTNGLNNQKPIRNGANFQEKDHFQQEKQQSDRRNSIPRIEDIAQDSSNRLMAEVGYVGRA